MNSGTFLIEPISASIRSTASFAPPCSGPYSAAAAAATAEYGSTCELPTARIAFVEQFCSWSAWRMKSTSSARSTAGFGVYFTSVVLNIMLRKLPVAERGDGDHLRDEAVDLLLPALRVEDVLGLGVQRAEGGDRGDQLAHRMGVVAERVEEQLELLVDDRVVGDVVRPLLELPRVRELAVEEEVGDLEVSAFFGELLDRIAAVLEDAFVAVDEGDGAAARRGVHERRVVRHHPEVVAVDFDLPQVERLDRSILDRDLVAFPGAVIGDGERVLRQRFYLRLRIGAQIYHGG